MNTSDNDNISGLREVIAELNRSNAEMLQALKQAYERLIDQKNKPGSFKNPLPLGILYSAISAAEQPPTLAELAARRKNQRGSILPEILMLGAILFTLVFGGIHYARKSDAAVDRWAAAQGWNK